MRGLKGASLVGINGWAKDACGFGMCSDLLISFLISIGFFFEVAAFGLDSSEERFLITPVYSSKHVS